MASYKRKCNNCGRVRQLREMPDGQWVAFDGYSKVHKCRHKPENKKLTKKTITKKAPPKSIQPLPGSRPLGIEEIARVAFLQGNVFRMVYSDRYGRMEHRDIEIIEIRFPYIRAYCRLRGDFRTFRIDRISNAIVSTLEVENTGYGVDDSGWFPLKPQGAKYKQRGQKRNRVY